jgi:hypothetical protein
MAKKKAAAKKNTVAEKTVVAEKTIVAEKKVVPEKKAVLDRDFMDLLRGANSSEEAGQKTPTIDSSIIGLFETALNSIKDAKHRNAQGQDVTKEILNATEYLQFGISKLKAANK